jgi:ABC-2 type transport system permease protein
MTAVLAIARNTTRQLLGVKRLIGFGLLTLSPAFLFFLSSRNVSPSRLLDQFLGIGLGTFFIIVVPVVTLIVSASALGDERRDSTLSFIVLRPIPRWKIALAKLGSAFVASFALTGTGALAMGVMYGLRGDEWGYAVPMVVGAAIATAVYGAVFVPLGYLAERSTLLGLAYVFIWENGVAAVTGLSSTSPWRIGYSAFYALVPESGVRQIEDFGVPGVDGGIADALTTGLIFLVLSATVITLFLKRRDLA